MTKLDEFVNKLPLPRRRLLKLLYLLVKNEMTAVSTYLPQIELVLGNPFRKELALQQELMRIVTKHIFSTMVTLLFG